MLDRLERIAIPTLIVWGRDDSSSPPPIALGFQERIAGSELVVFEECGHVPMVERPMRFNRLIAGFAEPDGERSGSAAQA